MQYYNTVRYSIIQYATVQYSITIQYTTLQCSIIIHYNAVLQSDMGQAFTEVLEAQLQALIKGLKHKHKHLCFQKINA